MNKKSVLSVTTTWNENEVLVTLERPPRHMLLRLSTLLRLIDVLDPPHYLTSPPARPLLPIIPHRLLRSKDSRLYERPGQQIGKIHLGCLMRDGQAKLRLVVPQPSVLRLNIATSNVAVAKKVQLDVLDGLYGARVSRLLV